jgi:adenosylmethionine-8-amino-7-oxononanoate aminotransferase
MHNIAAETGKLKNVRGIGAVVAADLTTDQPRVGYEVYQQAVKLGALLRPLGNTIYWTPPLNVGLDVAEQLARVTKQALMMTDF